ncbi:hypothetical protein PHJA_002484600 [Phtheirospermum japonicum]|uniref:FLZ-type domain-containing protein n=1 Tax=Phtheirospermum japonicum TaxID=374723 RepID=A0A830CS64_9LAMI|nr:hypothetical protein PHJA_002484600 [Phtheirospermum japonicum]
MVGLSVILENYRDLSEKRSPQVIRKGSMIKPPSNPCSPTTPKSPYYYNNNNINGFLKMKNISNSTSVCGFLEYCFLCNQKLLPGKDIYMYKGDKGFCSEECRCRQIFMDEEETNNATNGCTREYNCSLAATSHSTASSSSSSPSSSRSGKAPRNRANGFAF